MIKCKFEIFANFLTKLNETKQSYDIPKHIKQISNVLKNLFFVNNYKYIHKQRFKFPLKK